MTGEHRKVGLLFYENPTVYFDVFSVFPNGRITVPDDYPTIQEAINNANDGDTIFVRNGLYYEHVAVNRAVSLIGESREGTVVDGNGTGSVFLITASSVS